MTATALAPAFEPLQVPLIKDFDCGHRRADAALVLPGMSMHCHTCRTLADVVAVSIARNHRVARVTRDRLLGEGYTHAEVRVLARGGMVRR
jgi:hypothetical protein